MGGQHSTQAHRRSRSYSAVRLKLLLIGDSGCGKSTFVTLHRTGQFTDEHVPTVGVTVHPIMFGTSCGQVEFDCWDTAGDSRYAGLGSGYYASADAAILMFDVTSRSSFESLDRWRSSLLQVCPAVSLLMCGTKTDLAASRVVAESEGREYASQHGLEYHELSSRAKRATGGPFIELARKFTGSEEKQRQVNECTGPLMIRGLPDSLAVMLLSLWSLSARSDPSCSLITDISPPPSSETVTNSPSSSAGGGRR